MDGDCDANLKGIVGLFLPRRLSSNRRHPEFWAGSGSTAISILYLALERRINQSVLVELLLVLSFLLALEFWGSQNGRTVSRVNELTTCVRLSPVCLDPGVACGLSTGYLSPGPPQLFCPGQALAKLALVLLASLRTSSRRPGSSSCLCWLLGDTQQSLVWTQVLGCVCYGNPLSPP